MKAEKAKMSKKIKKFVLNRHSGGGHLTAASKLFCGKTLYLLLILFLSIALFAGLIFTVGGGSNGFLSDKPQDVSNAASSTPNNASGTWITDGRQASGFAGGSGTADDPYQIATAAQLAYLSYMIYNDLAPVQKVTETDTDSNGQVEERRTYYYNYLDTYFELTATIDLSNYYWQPIGRYENLGSSEVPHYHYRAFSGHFDGNNYSILGVYLNNTLMAQGLFGEVMGKSSNVISISNVHVTGYISGGGYTGGIIGRASYVNVSNCSNASTIYTSEDRIGGVIGSAVSTVKITNCWNLGDVKGGLYTGGVVGHGASATVSNCYNKGYIRSTGHGGGIAGVAGKIYDCYNMGDIYVSTTATSGGGGIVGYGSAVTIQRCYNFGDVYASDHSGGIYGFATLTAGQYLNIYDCYNFGEISGGDAVGGIAGEIRYWAGADITITRCYNAGSIRGSSQVGGISGLIYKYGGSTSISNCINIGSVSGSNRGGIVGDRTGSSLLGKITYTNNQYSQNIGAVDGATQSGCTYVSTLADDIKSQDYFATNFSTWDFNSVWTFIEGENNGYPIFQYQTQPYNIIFNARGGAANFADVFEGFSYSYTYNTSTHTYSFSNGQLNVTYDTQSHILTLNGTGDFSVNLPSAQNITFKQGDKYVVTTKYISGSTSGSVGCFVLEAAKTPSANMSSRNFVNHYFPTSGSATATLTVSAFAETNGSAVRNWFWNGDTTTKRSFSNYQIQYRVAKTSGDGADIKSITVNEKIDAVSIPYKDGFIFKGYYSQPNGEGTQYFDETGACVLQPKDDIVLYAAWEDNTWLGHAADSFAGGSGSQSSPYLIETAEQLALLSYNVYNGVGAQDEYVYVDTYFKQIADIDLSTYPWVPIGVYYNLDGVLTDFNFAGNFDGGGYTISGIKMLELFGEPYNRRGLFGRVNGENCSIGAEIKNIVLTDSTITGGDYVGALIGYAGLNVSISNCTVDVTVTGSGNYVGGIAGSYDGNVIQGCSADGEITGVGYVGGIVGNSTADISNCSVDATITGTGNCIGGIVGGGEGTSVTNCEAYGSVTGVHYTGGIMGNGVADISGCSNYAIVKGNERVGGMIGNGLNCSVSGCFNFEKISGSAGIAGIVGLADNVDILSCYNLADISGNYGGGIAGRITNNTTIKFGVNTGKITSDNFAGGIAGDTITGSTITQSLNLGDIVSSTNNAGGILGSASNANVSTITNCYSNCNISASSCGALVGGTNAVTISYCAGISNTGSGFYASTSQSGVTNSYVVCNGVLTLSQTTSGMDGNFGYNASFHDGLPIPHGIYAITEFFTQTGIQSYLQNKF